MVKDTDSRDMFLPDFAPSAAADTRVRQVAVATAAGIAGAALLLFILGDIGAYAYPLSILGGLLISVLGASHAVFIKAPLPEMPEPAAGTRWKGSRNTPFILILISLASLLVIAIILPLFSLCWHISSNDSALTYYMLPAGLFALSILCLCLAGELLVSRSEPAYRGKSSLRAWSHRHFRHFSWAACSLFVYAVLLFFLLRLVLPGQSYLWDSLLEMSIAGVAASGLAWISRASDKEHPMQSEEQKPPPEEGNYG